MLEWFSHAGIFQFILLSNSKTRRPVLSTCRAQFCRPQACLKCFKVRKTQGLHWSRLSIGFEVSGDVLKVDGTFCFTIFGKKAVFLLFSTIFQLAKMFKQPLISPVVSAYWHPCWCPSANDNIQLLYFLISDDGQIKFWSLKKRLLLSNFKKFLVFPKPVRSTARTSFFPM